VGVDLSDFAERLIHKFDREPDLKGRIARAIFELDDGDEPNAETRHDGDGDGP
jgi:hypothetical protein